ncbi:MAG TPA: metallophosphoesterase [Nevskiaceae bacterium]
MAGWRLNVLSDLHLSLADLDPPDVDADITVLAGDLGRPEQAIAWARRIEHPVVYVAGNHEFYGSGLSATVARLRELAAGTRVHVLEHDALVIDGLRFLGTTLWTDFRFGVDGVARAQAMHDAPKYMRDFTRIESDEHPGIRFTPEESTHVFARSRGWLARQLATPFSGPTIVVTHHAPSPQSVHPRFAGSWANCGFVTDLEALMGGDRVALWVHGHTHDSFDYVVRGTRVLCNARGYHRGGADENAAFDPRLVAEVWPVESRVVSQTG